MQWKLAMTLISPRHHTTHHGFTLIELSLSIAFIGILSIIIALLINETIATYRRGLTLNQINTVGMDLVDDIRTAIQNSSSKSLISECQSLYGETNDDKTNLRGKCSTDGGKNLVSVTKYAKVTIRNGEEPSNVPIYGALCTGTYSYIWNSGYFFDSNDQYTVDGVQSPAVVRYKNSDNTTTDIGDADNPFKLLKIEDKTRAVCAYSMSNGDVENSTYKSDTPLLDHEGIFDISGSNETITEEPVRLLAEDTNDTSLALYDLQASAPVESSASNSLFYSVSFILGTVDGGIDIMSQGNFCATPNDYEDANFDYCAINKFNFAARATGE